jgi:hypothetical protein
VLGGHRGGNGEYHKAAREATHGSDRPRTSMNIREWLKELGLAQYVPVLAAKRR